MTGATDGSDGVFGGGDPAPALVGLSAPWPIVQRQPETLKVARPGERSVAFSFGVRRRAESNCHLVPQRAWVGPGFLLGASLPDPDGPLDGKGRAPRHLTLGPAAERPFVGALIAALAEYPAAAGRAP